MLRLARWPIPAFALAGTRQLLRPCVTPHNPESTYKAVDPRYDIHTNTEAANGVAAGFAVCTTCMLALAVAALPISEVNAALCSKAVQKVDVQGNRVVTDYIPNFFGSLPSPTSQPPTQTRECSQAAGLVAPGGNGAKQPASTATPARASTMSHQRSKFRRSAATETEAKAARAIGAIARESSLHAAEGGRDGQGCHALEAPSAPSPLTSSEKGAGGAGGTVSGGGGEGGVARCAQLTGRLLAWYVFTPLETAHGNIDRPARSVPRSSYPKPSRCQQWSPCLQRDVMVHGFARTS